MKPSISIIVVIDFKDKIEEFLKPFLHPEIGKKGYQIIIVEDAGYKYPFVKKQEQFYTEGGAEVQILRFRRTGRAYKRNRGLEKAMADIVVLFAGDFVPTPTTFDNHLDFHTRHAERNKVAVGPAVFIPEERTPFMVWLEDSGSLFGVPFLRYKKEEPVDYFYGANTSLKKEYLLSMGGFDEIFPYDSSDDYDMGRRLKKAGMEAFIVPSTTVVHEHHVTLEQRLMAMRWAGKSTVLLDNKYPDETSWQGERTVSVQELEHEASENMKHYQHWKGTPQLDKYYELVCRATFCKEYQRAIKKANRKPLIPWLGI